MNYTDPSGHRECEIICDGETIDWKTYQDAAWTGEWDPEQQAANAAAAETVLTGVTETAVGILWEPADWALALRDGFQWYDSLGMLPFLPATVGKYGDEALHALNSIPNRLARVVPASIVEDITRLGPLGVDDVFVTAADDISDINDSRSLAERLTLLDSSGNLREGPFAVLEFDTPEAGIASPIARQHMGFVGKGVTDGGAREFVIPNMKLEDLRNLIVRILQ